MKNTVSFCSIVLILLLLASCKTEEQKLVSKLDGTWNIVSMMYIENDVPAVSLPQSGYISFGYCKIGDGKTQNCQGSYKFGDEPIATFDYQPTKTPSGELKAINFYSTSMRPKFEPSVNVEILSLSEKELVLEGKVNINYAKEGKDTTAFPIINIVLKKN
ncbi:hypothetical protein BH24BAC1_BH24BAC1_33680 [soil metagenome]|jgi:hypothetical protein